MQAGDITLEELRAKEKAPEEVEKIPEKRMQEKIKPVELRRDCTLPRKLGRRRLKCQE